MRAHPPAPKPDAGLPDAGLPDAGLPDAGLPDAGLPDAGLPDAGLPDAGLPDADERHMADSLLRSEKRFRALIENSSDLIATFDSEGRLGYLSPSFQRILGFSPAEWLGRSGFDLVHPDDRPQAAFALEWVARSPAASHSAQFRWLTAWGEFRWLEASLVNLLDEPGINAIVLNGRDITERLGTEKALLRSEALLRNILETLPVGVFVSDSHGKLILANPAGVKIWGVSPMADGMDRVDLYRGWRVDTGQPLAPEDWVLSQVLASGETTPAELIEIDAFDGRHKFILNQATPLHDEHGTLLGGIVIVQEMTERTLAARQLERTAQELARSNTELERFAYIASHDLQEPLRMVTAYLQLLTRRYGDRLDGDAEEFIGYAVEGAARMQRLIQDLLAYSRLGTHAKPPAPVDLERLLQQVLRALSVAIQESEAHITHDLLPTILADETQVGQLFQNLMSNALKFRHPERTPHIHIAAQPAEEHWIFSVRDNGIGIEARYFERIFVIFQRLHARKEYPGTGMGLAICKKIVERHGGQIWVESQPDQGTTFFFTLPNPRGDLPYGDVFDAPDSNLTGRR